MRKLDALRALARLVVRDTTDGVGELSEAARIVGAVIGSDDVRLFAGDGVNYEAYPRREAEDFFGLSSAGLLAASQELRRLGRPAVYTVGPDGLPHEVAPANGRCAGTHAALALWKGDTYGGTVVARGPWTAPAARQAGLFLESAGPALAIMLERVADADRTERVQQQVSVLADVARVFARAENMRDVLGDVVNAINSATSFLSSIDVLDTRGRIIMRSTAASRYTGTPLYNTWLQMTKAPDLVRRTILKDHQPVLLPALQTDPSISEEAREFYRRASIVSGATFPLLFQDDLVGLLRVGSLKPTSFGPPVVDLLQSLALQAAVVVKGVQLWEQLQRSQKETGRYARKLHARNQELLKEISERERAEEALRRSEELLAKAQEMARIGSWDHDMVTGRIRCSDQLLGMYGIKPEEFDGALDTILPAIHPDDRQKVVAGNAAAYMENRAEPIEFRIVAPGGTERVAWAEVELVFDDAGNAVRMVGTVQDITERKRAEEALRESEEKYRGIFENVQDIYFETEVNGTIVELSPSVERFGYTREELIGTSVLDIYENADERAAFVEALLKHGELVDYALRLKAGDGHVVDASASAHVRRGPDGTPVGIEGALRDISERKRMEEALREQVRRDPLTGVLNHAAIVDELRNLLSDGDHAASHAVAMVDVDGLKSVNDTYGHPVGDAVLTTVADTLSRDGTVVGRYGGDEFIAVLRETDRGAAESYRKAVLDALASAGLTDPETGGPVPVVASIGLAIYPHEADTIADLIRLADSAMYAARRERPVGPTGLATTGALGGDRAAEMVGQIVALLTPSDKLEDKLRLVAQRISVGAGYDAVNIDIFSERTSPPNARNVFAEVPNEVIESWRADQRRMDEDPFVQLLLRTRRGIIVDDPQNDQRLTETQRGVLRAAQLRSAAVVPLFWEDELIGILSAASKREGAFTPRDVQFLTTVATQVTAIVRMASLVDQLQATSDHLAQAKDETVLLLASAAEAHDRTTGLHLQSVRALTQALARELGHSEEDAKELGLAAVLHDIGKIRVPDSVLASTGQLADEEWELMKRHTVWGAEFLAGRPGFELAATIARSHHECWNGSGYPDGMSGKAIPEAATIVAVADAFDAIINDRPYRKGQPVVQAIREIRACSGTQFSPKVVEAVEHLHGRKTLPVPAAQARGKAA